MISKNWLILKIQPSGFAPLNLGTSSFMRCEEDGDAGERMTDEEEGE